MARQAACTLGDTNAHAVCMGKPEGIRPPARQRYREKDHSKSFLKYT
jgi:hypothetical protein